MKKVAFVTGTRADFGKLKPLIRKLNELPGFEPEVFVTGMHLLQHFGSTWEEVVKSNLAPVHPYVNQAPGDRMEIALGKTIVGLSDYVQDTKPDLLVVHGDRVEALAGASVGALSNVRVAHVEGGEVSGTIDEALRHAISKLSHWHFVSNRESKKRLLQLGENEEDIFVIGSPDIDVMDSPELPSHREALSHYGLDWSQYAILIFHPVTTELENLETETTALLDFLANSGQKTIVIESNNDTGSDIIRAVYSSYRSRPDFRFFPSMRFEYFLPILRHAEFIIGNSSAGIREAPHYGVPALNVGSRQSNRVVSSLVVNSDFSPGGLEKALREIRTLGRVPEKNFGEGNSAELFSNVLLKPERWNRSLQKVFVDLEPK